MKKYFLVFCISCLCSGLLRAQEMVTAARQFLRSLDSAQRLEAMYPFDGTERYNFHFFPIDDRKGVPLRELNADQRRALFRLLHTGLSERTVRKTDAIRELDNVLKVLEHRKPDDHYRDPEKYFLAVFGIPGPHTIWGWRFEGHHVSFTFAAENGKLVSGTPGFLGANPAVVQEGPNKGEEVLKDETAMGYELLHAFTPAQMQQVRVDTAAPGDIITFINRKAMIAHPAGMLYAAMTDTQKQLLLRMLRLYIERYTRLFADQMLKEIQAAGLDNLRFAWAGDTAEGIGHPHYYRIQGPTIIIEYDNTQNNANHVHTVIRDLKNDFGDELLEHYKSDHAKGS